MTDTPFAAIPAEVARSPHLHYAAKALFMAIASYADKAGRAWPSQETLAECTGMSESTVKRHLTALRDAGLLTWEVRSTLAGRQRFYQVWRPGQEMPEVGSSGGGGRVTTGPTHRVTTAGELEPQEPEPQEPPHAADAAGADVIALFPIEVEQTGPPKTAQTLVARWCDGYRERTGESPPKAFMGRVAGQGGQLARACGDDHGEWVRAYHAAYQAGHAGHADMTRHLVPQAQQRASGRGNAFASTTFGGPSTEQVADFAAMLRADRPRAIGDGR